MRDSREFTIGSLFVYSFFSIARIANTNIDRLQKAMTP